MAIPTHPDSVGALLHGATVRLRDAGSESARLDAELLLGHALGVGRPTLIAHPEAAVGEGPRSAFQSFVSRRAKGEPVAYIRGVKEFHGVALLVDARALIPRPETELLVDLGIACVREALTSSPRPAGAAPLAIWDVGTGSGAIIVAMAIHLRRHGFVGESRLLASDPSADALALAVENAVVQGVADLVSFAAGDLLDPVAEWGAVDLLLANLPYVPSHEVERLPVAASFEPRAALDGGVDGLAIIRRLLAALPGGLVPGGVALLEIGSGQGQALTDSVTETLPGWTVTIHADLSGGQRVARIVRPDD
jgi:release factor glutamine methyltransferase